MDIRRDSYSAEMKSHNQRFELLRSSVGRMGMRIGTYSRSSRAKIA